MTLRCLGPLSLSLLIATLLIGCDSTEAPSPSLDMSSLRQTEYGPVVGMSDRYETYAWLNIPFAAPPVDDLRWKAPRAPQVWKENREAIEYGQPCVQMWGMMAGTEGSQGDIVGSEDCLSLNIWAPKNLPKDKKLPVMLWIHGGGNTAGTANTYRGHHLASDQEVIYVGINYRLGLFGTFAHKSLRDEQSSAEDNSGNYALLDIIASLQWVQRNIGEFGGDKANVTIFGESAGGRNVYSMLASPLAKGLFHKAIIQSASTDTIDPRLAEAFRESNGVGYRTSSNEILVQTLISDAKAHDIQSAKALIGEQSDSEVSTYLRSKSPQTLMSNISDGGTGMYNAPHSLSDGYVLPKQPLMSLLEDDAHFNSVPTIVGSNRDENKVFMALDPQWTNRLLGLFPRINDPEKYDLYSSYYSQQWKILAVDEPATRLSEHRPDQTFAYRFDWDNTPSNWLVDFPALIGAGHSLEIGFVFGDFEDGINIKQLNTKENLQDRLELSSTMMNYWGNFAHHGIPGKGSDNKATEWKPWSNDIASLMILDGQTDQGVRMTNLRLSAQDLKQLIATDPRIHSQKERCQLYAQSFMLSFQTKEFWNKDQYNHLGSAGCKDYPPHLFQVEY